MIRSRLSITTVVQRNQEKSYLTDERVLQIVSRFATPVGLLVLLLIAAILPTSVMALSPTDNSNAPTDSVQMGTTPFARNNSTIHQEDPDNVQSDDDLSGLEGWLSGRLSSRLGGSTVKIKQGQYKKAHSVLGDRYNDMLKQIRQSVREDRGDTGR